MLGNKYSGKFKHLVSIGGGVSSTLELPLHVINKYGSDNVDLVICALAGESPDLWRMVEWLEERTGKHVYRVAWQAQKHDIYYGLQANYWIDAPTWAWSDIWDVFFKVGRMGSNLADPCSRILKRETMRDFVLDHYDVNNTIMHVGITAGEIDRMIAIQGNWRKVGVKVRAELADTPDLTTKPSAERARDILGWIPFVYEWGASHNNCGGFCVKAGHGQMAKLLYYVPELYAYHEQREREFQALFNTTATIMRDVKTVNGERFTSSLSLEAFRLRMQAKWAGLLPGMIPYDDIHNSDETGCTFCTY